MGNFLPFLYHGPLADWSSSVAEKLIFESSALSVQLFAPAKNGDVASTEQAGVESGLGEGAGAGWRVGMELELELEAVAGVVEVVEVHRLDLEVDCQLSSMWLNLFFLAPLEK